LNHSYLAAQIRGVYAVASQHAAYTTRHHGKERDQGKENHLSIPLTAGVLAKILAEVLTLKILLLAADLRTNQTPAISLASSINGTYD